MEIPMLTLYQGMPAGMIVFFLLLYILLMKNNSSISHDAF